MTNQTKITTSILEQLGFILEECENDDNEIIKIWHKDGVSLHQDNWSDDFLFATYHREDGSFKSGFSIETIEQLNYLFLAFKRKSIL